MTIRMSRRVRLLVGGAAAGAMVGVLSCGLVSGAQALWALNQVQETAPVNEGAVQFGAQPLGDVGAAEFSADGGAVHVRLPGTVIAQVVGQTGGGSGPVIWRFQARGWAQGIAGIDFDVAPVEQVAKDGSTTSLAEGRGRANTLLARSTAKIYPAAVNGDCSQVPETPEGDARDVIVYEGRERTLQEPEAYTGAETVQDWCVAIAYDAPPDGLYVNDVAVDATGDDGRSISGLDRWASAVGVPPSLEPAGEYVNSAETSGTGVDGSEASDATEWRSMLYPDPSNEPDLVIALDPLVTTTRPDVRAGDRYVPAQVSRPATEPEVPAEG
ncbi:hypothetical protein [Microbacterium rhizophilus]|uniref:hypothetical protein n=1 Tax=Microbacterium rhizophilus TaxID=3138934 RepID=UPI0031EC7AA8